MFPNPLVKQFWHHQVCKLFQNITSTLAFRRVFGIHCNFFIVLTIWLKTCRSNVFFFLRRQNMRARKIGKKRGFARPSAPMGAQFVQAWYDHGVDPQRKHSSQKSCQYVSKTLKIAFLSTTQIYFGYALTVFLKAFTTYWYCFLFCNLSWWSKHGLEN